VTAPLPPHREEKKKNTTKKNIAFQRSCSENFLLKNII